MIFRKDRQILGFTLTEMMIVIAIIGILAVIAIVSFMAQQHKGNDSKRKADMDRIKIAVEEYEKDNNCYPSASTMSTCGNSVGIAIHPYLNDVPCDPTTGQPYRYEVEDSLCPDWFRLYSLLQYTKDPDVIPNIGPTGETVYNYYVSSNNAPDPLAGSGSTPYVLPPGCEEANRRYGCMSGQCVEVQLNPSCAPVCDPAYDSPTCYGQCVPDNSASECVTL